MSFQKKVLVTGAAGFIGGHICRSLRDRGYKVLAIDDLSSGSRSNLCDGVEFNEIDIRDVAAIDRVFESFRPNIISHHAAQTSVSVSAREPLRDADINIQGALNVLTAALRCRAERFVFASTGGAMYGEMAPGERASVKLPPLPQSPYACSKLAFEGYLRGLTVGTSLQWSILRYANVYGPRQNPHGEAGVVAIFINKLLSHDELTIFACQTPGDGGCTRDYIYVDDVVRIHGEACAGALDGRINNVGTGIATSTLEIAKRLAAILGQDLAIVDAGPRDGDLMRSVLLPMCGNLLTEVNLQTGLEATVAWFSSEV